MDSFVPTKSSPKTVILVQRQTRPHCQGSGPGVGLGRLGKRENRTPFSLRRQYRMREEYRK